MSSIKSKEDLVHVVLANDLFPMVDNSGAVGKAVSMQQIEDFVFTGGATYTDPVLLTSHWRFVDSLQSGDFSETNEAKIAFYSGAAGIVAGGDSGGSTPMSSVKITELNYGGGNAKSGAAQIINSIENLSNPPTDRISPFEGLDVVISMDPDSGVSGTPATIPDIRGIDLDFNCISGTAQRMYGTTARMRYGVSGTVDLFCGHKTIGPNLTDTAGTLTDYIGFHAGWDERATASGAIAGDFIGLQVDAHEQVHPDMTITGDQIGVWLNGNEDLNGDAGVSLVFGIDKGSKLFRYSVFGSSPKLVLQTNDLELRDTGSTFIHNPGSGSVPTLTNTPNGVSASTMKWIKVTIGALTYYIPSWSNN